MQIKTLVPMDDGAAPTFDSWVSPHLEVMRRFAIRLTSANEADDIVQESLATAWRLRRRYDERRGSARTWLLTLTADQIRQHRRRMRRVPVPRADPTDAACFDVVGDLDLRAAVDRLTDRQRLAVAAYYYLDLPVGDVAAIMACSPGTVKSTLAAARERLHTMLKKGDDDAR